MHGMPTAPRRIADVIAWLLPAAVFAVAGVGKVLDPSGTTPSGLQLSEEAYHSVLRTLGIGELVLAALIALPRSRRGGLIAGIAVVAGFDVLAALHADDGAFLSDCGCFGAFSVPSGSAALGVLVILLRNAVLVLAASFALLRRRAPAPRIGIAAVCGVVAFAAPLLLAQEVTRRAQAARLQAIEQGRRRMLDIGWRVPDLPLRTASGGAVTARTVLDERDVLVFFSPGCAACRRHAASWSAYGQRLREERRRLVPVGVGRLAAVREFLAAQECADLPAVVIEDPLVALRLGVLDVPRTWILGPQLRVVATDLVAESPSSWSALTAALGDEPRLAEPLARSLARQIFGEVRARVSPDPSDPHGFAVELDDGRGRLAVLQSSHPSSESLVIAVGLDEASGVLVGYRVLAASAVLEMLDPDQRRFDILMGSTAGRAVAAARELAATAPFEAPLWRAVARALQTVSG